MFKNLKVRNKIFILSFSLLFFIFVISFGSYRTMSYLNSELDFIYNNNLQAIQWLNDSKSQARFIQANTYYIIVNDGVKHEQNSRLKDIQESITKFQENIDNYKNSELDDYEIELIPSLEQSWSDFSKAREEIVKLALNGQTDEAKKKLGALDSYSQIFQRRLQELSDYNVQDAEKVKNDNNSKYMNALIMFSLLSIMACIFAIFLTILIIKNIIKPLNMIKDFANRMKKGDFTTDISLTRKDEFGKIGRALNEAQKQVGKLISEVFESIKNMNSAKSGAFSYSSATYIKLEDMDREAYTIAVVSQKQVPVLKKLPQVWRKWMQVFRCFQTKL